MKLKAQIMMKLKNSNYDKPQKLKWRTTQKIKL